jgi:hypothetical protein
MSYTPPGPAIAYNGTGATGGNSGASSPQISLFMVRAAGLSRKVEPNARVTLAEVFVHSKNNPLTSPLPIHSHRKPQRLL